MKVIQLIVTALACAVVIATSSLHVTLEASLAQAMLDVALGLVVFVVWRAFVLLMYRWESARDTAKVNADYAKKWRELEDKRWERERSRARRRRR